MASGKPVKPSTQATNTSFSPRLCSSVNTVSQSLAPSVSASHRPRTSLWPARFTPKRHVQGLVDHAVVLMHLAHQPVQIQDRVDRLQRAALPGLHGVPDRVGDLGDQGRRHLGPVEPLDKCIGDVARGHALGIQSENLAIQPGGPTGFGLWRSVAARSCRCGPSAFESVPRPGRP
jgi:hypothetical protein